MDGYNGLSHIVNIENFSKYTPMGLVANTANDLLLMLRGYRKKSTHQDSDFF